MLRGGLYRTDTAYDFTGRMLKCREIYDGRTMENIYVYDSRSRLLSVSASLNGNAPVSLIRNEYDEGCHKQCLRFYKRCKHHQ